MEKLINHLPNQNQREIALAAWENIKTPEDASLLLDQLYQDLWEVQTQPGNNYGPNHPWHYLSCVTRQVSKTLQYLIRRQNYALTITIPDSYEIEHDELIEDWAEETFRGEETLKRFIRFLVNLAHDWTIEAVLEDNGDDDGGPFQNIYFIKRGYNAYDLMHNSGGNPDETIWFPKGMLGIPWMYANAPELICSITQHVM